MLVASVSAYSPHQCNHLQVHPAYQNLVNDKTSSATAMLLFLRGGHHIHVFSYNSKIINDPKITNVKKNVNLCFPVFAHCRLAICATSLKCARHLLMCM